MKRVFTVSIDEELYQKAQERVKQRMDSSLSQAIRMLLREYADGRIFIYGTGFEAIEDGVIKYRAKRVMRGV